MVSNERELRSDVRGDYSYTVDYEIVTPEEFHSVREKTFRPLIPDMNKLKISRARSDKDGMDTGSAINGDIAEFFVRMDEKLDRILLMLSKNKAFSESSGRGTGNNISASGMNIDIDRPVKQGQIVHATMILSKAPFLYIDVYGEIIRVDSLGGKDSPLCQVGVKFLNLDASGREKLLLMFFSSRERPFEKGKKRKINNEFVTTQVATKAQRHKGYL